MKKHRGANKTATLSRTLLFGVGISFTVLLIFTLVFSGLIMATTNPVGNVKTVSLAVLLVSGAVSGFTVSKMKGDRGIFASFVSALIFVVIIIALSLILTKGKVGAVVFMNCLCYLLVSAFSSFFGRKRARRHRR